MVNSLNLKASVSFVGDGSTNKFYFGFDYINKQFVKVQVGAGSSPLTYLTDYTVDDRSVTLTDTPAVGIAIRVYRETPSDRIVEWTDGAFIKASQMTLENLQQLHLIEEAQDYPILNSLSKYPDGVNFNALGSRVINVSDPKDPQDVVTKNYMETVQVGFVAANTKILNDAKATLSATQQTQSKAQANETLSKAWATSTESPDNAEDTQSSTGKTQSSRSWALYSEGKAQGAATSATNALTSEQHAKSSETNAKTSETNAKTSETNASASAAASASSASASATSATNAKTSETNAKNSETNSEIYNQKAKKWAEATDSPDGESDTDSPTGYTQSAKIWAALSKEYAGLSKFKLPIGYYTSVAEMKASDTAIVGRPCVTLGYYEPNDGGGTVYIIRSKTNSDVDDGGSIIVLDNENVAELITDGTVNAKQFGAKGDGVTDDTEAIRKSFINYNSVFIPKGTYLVTKTLTVSKEMCICGETMESSILKLGGTEDIPIFDLRNGCIYPKFKNLGFTSTTEDASRGIGIASEGGGWNAEVSRCAFKQLRIGVYAHSITGLSIHKCYFSVLTYGILFSSKTPTDYDTTTFIDIRYTTFQYCNPALKVENNQNTYAQLLNLLCLSCDFEQNTQSIDFKDYTWSYTFINCWFEANTTPPKVAGGTWIGTMFQGSSYTTEEPTIRGKASTYISDKVPEGITTKEINLGNGANIKTDNIGNILSNDSPSTPYFISYREHGEKLTSNIPGLKDITKKSTGKYIIKLKDNQGNLKPFGWLPAITMVATAFNPSFIPLDENKEPIFPTSHYYIDVYGTNISNAGSYWDDSCAVDSLCVATYSDNDKTVPVDCNFTILLLGFTNYN